MYNQLWVKTSRNLTQQFTPWFKIHYRKSQRTEVFAFRLQSWWQKVDDMSFAMLNYNWLTYLTLAIQLLTLLHSYSCGHMQLELEKSHSEHVVTPGPFSYCFYSCLIQNSRMYSPNSIACKPLISFTSSHECNTGWNTIATLWQR